MTGPVSRLRTVNAEQDEAGGYRGIQNSEEDDCGHHERKGHLLVDLVGNGAERRGSHVVGTSVAVHDTSDQTEDKDLADGDGPECFRKVLGFPHFRNEARKGDLANKGVADIHESTHAHYESGSRWGYGVDLELAFAWVACGLAINAGKCRREDYRDESEGGRGSGYSGQGTEGSRERCRKRDDGGDSSEDDCAGTMSSDGVPPLGSDETVQAHDEDVWEEVSTELLHSNKIW